MLTLVELKRILSKAPVLAMLLFILPLFVAAGFLVGTVQPTEHLIDLENPSSLSQAMDNFEINATSDYYNTKLTKRLDDLVENLELHDPSFGYAEDLLRTFKKFCGSDDEIGGYLGAFFYVGAGVTDTAILGPLFQKANETFWDFNNSLNDAVSLKRVDIPADDYDSFMNAVDSLRECFNYPYTETFESPPHDEFAFYREKREQIHNVWIFSGGGNIQGILERTTELTLTEEHQTELLNIYESKIRPLMAISFTTVKDSITLTEFHEQITRYGELADISADYLQAQHRSMQNANDSTNNASLAVLDVLVTNRASTFDYSTPFSFMEVMHTPTGTSAFDFVFNCFEIISIPLLIFAVMVVIFCIYGDIKKRTIYQTLVSPQGRKRIIGAKLLASMWTIAIVMAIFFLLFYFTAVIMFGSTTVPTVLTVFSGKALTLSPWTLLLIYLGSLFSKILFFGALTALFCVNASSTFSILLRVLICVVVVFLANWFFSKFTFWQYVPFLAFEFAQYLGVKTMILSQAAAHYNWIFTLPVMFVAFIMLVYGTIKRFNARDF